MWLQSSTRKLQWLEYLISVFLEIQNVTIWSVFQNQVTYRIYMVFVECVFGELLLYWVLYIGTVLHNILHLGKISNLPVEGAHLVVVLLVPVPVPVLVALGVPIAGDGMADIPIVNN